LINNKGRKVLQVLDLVVRYWSRLSIDDAECSEIEAIAPSRMETLGMIVAIAAFVGMALAFVLSFMQ
jgi:hypothetical protein